ncbi:AAEL007210-PA [Aedes aegypti]|uniref:AAEL007210-PA n=1 Tax=Aedes aegypti TaxID=7159 RepID=Q173B3_AEDAE|nr:AAEL007210-PA [Aedes aegypti]
MSSQSRKKWKTVLKSGNFKRKVNKYRSAVSQANSKNSIRFPEMNRQRKILKPKSSASHSPTSSFLHATDDETECSLEILRDGLDASIKPEDCGLLSAGHSESKLNEPSLALPNRDNEDDDSIDNKNYDVYKEMNLEMFLNKWSIDYRISHRALKPLLQKLNEHHPQLPVDPRRLLSTPRNKPKILTIEGGYYWHHSIEYSLRSFYERLSESCTASININIDGLPLFKNGTAQVWPILISITERAEIPPIIAGIFHGNNKPKRVEEFLKPFVEEILPIISDGLLINNHKLTVKIRSIICDAPARAFVKGV